MKRIFGRLFSVLLCFLLLTGTQTVVFAEDMQETGTGEADAAGQLNAQRLTIDAAGVYTLTGSMQGTVYVDPGAGEVTLLLDNVEIRSGSEPAIMAVSGDKLTIEMQRNTCNAIADSAENTLEAAVYTEVDTVIQGCGCLQINGNSKYGIVTKDASLSVNSGSMLIVSESSGIRADGEKPGPAFFNGGIVYINAKNDGILAVPDVRMNGGSVQTSEAVRICDICGCCGVKNNCCVCGGQAPCKEEETCTGNPCSCCTPTTDTPGEITEGTVTNSAEALTPDEENAVDIVFGDETTKAEISESGTYVITGTSSNGGITVLQGTKGVVLILKDLNLTSTTGAELTINSDAEVQIVVEGDVSLIDASPSEGAADADGAALKAEDNTAVCITGDGKLTVKSNAKNGIKTGKNSSLVTSGETEVEITAAKDGIRSEGDVAIKNTKVTIEAGEVGVHADDILTIGDENGSAPEVTVDKCREGLEANVVNIESGTVEIHSSEDAIDTETNEAAANPPEASVNMTGGELIIEAGGSAIDSDGNINLIEGSAEFDTEGKCVDFADDLYVSDDFEIDCNCGNSAEAAETESEDDTETESESDNE